MEPIMLITPFSVTTVILVLYHLSRVKSTQSAGRNKRLRILSKLNSMRCQHFFKRLHLNTRQIIKDSQSFIEQLCVADVKQNLQPNQSTLTVFTNSKGGIIDDLIVTKLDDRNLYIVSNAGCRHKDIPLMTQKIEEMQR